MTYDAGGKLIRIRYLYEECDYSPLPEWTTEDEDKRLFTADLFGRVGDAWATVVTVHLVDENPLIRALLGKWKQFHSSIWVPLGEMLQLRVCPATFDESDPRFLRDGKHLALIQTEFDMKLVDEYCKKRIRECAHLRGPAFIAAMETTFYVFDPSED